MDLDEHAVFGPEYCPAADAVPPLFRRPNVVKPALPLLCKHDRPARLPLTIPVVHAHVPGPHSGTRFTHRPLVMVLGDVDALLLVFNNRGARALATSTLHQWPFGYCLSTGAAGTTTACSSGTGYCRWLSIRGSGTTTACSSGTERFRHLRKRSRSTTKDWSADNEKGCELLKRFS